MKYQSLLVVLGLAGCGSSAGSADDTGPDAAISDDDGQGLFAASCASCHGDGSGTSLGPTILNPVPGYATFVVRSGRNEMGYPGGGMAPFTPAALTDVQLQSILAFLGTAPHPADGAGLYARFCTNCHGADGRSGRVGKNITRELAALSLLVRAGHGGTAYGSRASYMPSWSTTEITDAELSLIQSYVASL